MMTAKSKAENVVAAKQAGVNNYIVKPSTLHPQAEYKGGRRSDRLE